MSASSESVIGELEQWSKQLRSIATTDPEAFVDPVDQLAVENSVAAGVSVLAAEPLPEPTTEQSGRPILAKDLVITTDLVLRALRAADQP